MQAEISMLSLYVCFPYVAVKFFELQSTTDEEKYGCMGGQGTLGIFLGFCWVQE